MEKDLIKKMYSEKFEFKTEDGKNFEVPVSGSLGLLAIGYRGIIACRKKRHEELKKAAEQK